MYEMGWQEAELLFNLVFTSYVPSCFSHVGKRKMLLAPLYGFHHVQVQRS